MMSAFQVYILQCRDGSLYTGYAKDLKARLKVHAQGRGSKYVKSRMPFRLVYSESAETKSEAMRRENQIKSLTRQEKIELVRSGSCS